MTITITVSAVTLVWAWVFLNIILTFTPIPMWLALVAAEDENPFFRWGTRLLFATFLLPMSVMIAIHGLVRELSDLMHRRVK